MRAKILPAKDWQLPFSVVDTGYAGICELLWNLSFIPNRLEYLFHFLHHGCDTCFEHFSGDCVWSWHFARSSSQSAVESHLYRGGREEPVAVVFTKQSSSHHEALAVMDVCVALDFIGLLAVPRVLYQA
ncbi:unnamed protein product, partial [Porites evermanni]